MDETTDEVVVITCDSTCGTVEGPRDEIPSLGTPGTSGRVETTGRATGERPTSEIPDCTSLGIMIGKTGKTCTGGMAAGGQADRGMRGLIHGPSSIPFPGVPTPFIGVSSPFIGVSSSWKQWYQRRVLFFFFFSCVFLPTHVSHEKILGIRDRHQDNMMIKDDMLFFHIDFGFILNDAPGFDAPIFSIPNGMRRYLSQTEWKFFVRLCGDAFACLHEYCGIIINTCETLLGKLPDIPLAQIRKYLVASLMVNLTVDQARSRIFELVEEGSTSKQKEMKYFVHGLATRMK
eukprot:TRINITY_DN11093_c0_g1_i3.p1 TRINITY_DN11093_c0_g1~~TRINITY_DN11093_c0_g1_i3.p1  ORF type:complete len:310 (+),score=84.10 TRINITY_DN11093_c0_g1_i3:64-930(+)